MPVQEATFLTTKSLLTLLIGSFLRQQETRSGDNRGDNANHQKLYTIWSEKSYDSKGISYIKHISQSQGED